MTTTTPSAAPPTAAEPAGAPHPAAARPRGWSLLAALLVPPLVLLGVVKPFVADSYRIASDSMAPALQPGDHVIVDKVSYHLTAPQRGDLVVLTDPASGEVLLKRLAAVAGDTLTLDGGALVINGQRQSEPYLDPQRGDGLFYGPVTVPPGHVFVLADARVNTVDSRTLGPIPHTALLGRAVLRAWPPVRAGAPG